MCCSSLQGSGGIYRWLGPKGEKKNSCQFNKPEQWKPLRGTMCREYDIWELKPKPYRLAFFKDNFKGKNCFVVFAAWKKEGGKRDRELIGRICGEAPSIIELWNKFKRQEEI